MRTRKGGDYNCQAQTEGMAAYFGFQGTAWCTLDNATLIILEIKEKTQSLVVWRENNS